MRKYVQGFIGGFLICLLLSGTVVYAATGSSKIEVYFKNLTYLFDGVKKAPPQDAKGFIYNGNTYVPLRFITETLGKEVKWDGTTETISIGNSTTGTTTTPSPTPTPNASAQNEQYLSELVYDSKEGDAYAFLSLDNWEKFAWNTIIGDPFQIHGMIFRHGLGVHLNKSGPPWEKETGGAVTYSLNGQYKKLTGYVGIDDSVSKSKGKGKLTVTGDGKVLSVTSDVIANTDSIAINVDITNVKVLEIRFQSNRNDQVNLVFAEAKLVK
ncbi:hypothetical protein A8709_21805 [Paenibacillus pectinilyticus]|uniref:Glycosyl hydrolase family 98 putative carbohydrate-binding module domain-containing protein n=1 Tax=Paenibacillus pectinilyticus TaxID=512399 RepID=A0A1C0ZY64_9BACL|nr:NPCBM/NEW2 domain-containing protein [Paenibacillus pectinilyticus]OCT12960.1 hypothetical protein A8709_21805 [Paenibacillus pectinilyticus]